MPDDRPMPAMPYSPDASTGNRMSPLAKLYLAMQSSGGPAPNAPAPMPAPSQGDNRLGTLTKLYLAMQARGGM